MKIHPTLSARSLPLLLALLAVSACVGDSPLVPGIPAPHAEAGASGDVEPWLPPAVVTVCVVAPPGAAFRISLWAAGGTLQVPPVTWLVGTGVGSLPGNCVEVWRATLPRLEDDPLVPFRLTITGHESGAPPERLTVLSDEQGGEELAGDTREVSFQVNYTHGGMIWIKTLATPDPFTPRWVRLSGGVQGPPAVVASTFDVEGNAVYALSHPDEEDPSLWRFSLGTSSWKRIPAEAWPSGLLPRLVLDEQDRRFLVLREGTGEPFALPRTGGEWTPMADPPSAALSRRWEGSLDAAAGVPFMDAGSGRLNLLEGGGSLWEWDPGRKGWSLRAGGGIPMAREEHTAVTVDPLGRRVFAAEGWVDGGSDDLAVLQLADGRWFTRLASGTGGLEVRGSALSYAHDSGLLFRFGGRHTTFDLLLSALYWVDPQEGDDGWRHVVVAGPTPSPRELAGLFHDFRRGRILLVAGRGKGGWMNDVWELRLPRRR